MQLRSQPEKTMRYLGHCHCKAVEFEVEAPANVVCHECNCSICSLTGFLHMIVPKSAFQLIRGRDALSSYTFNTGVAQHYFCRHCGVKSFYIPRSNPNGYDVNVRCLDPAPRQVNIEPFDGQNWEDHAYKLEGLSKEP